ncbi:MAG: hypothetical protein A2W99_04735 [Bacteroidetes bacterium GWF2_33_16]|nr:MAG: hypothetical protein A2X00_17255 [Bacteroidetes bacterium GWE2_32_14]OFY05975.1 MAG: hypothetical protein A2W99_04735 [Bacteroidetes bacterium GWF2_33_16]
METGKKIAILQSNYIPWKGYFDIINSVDEFIIYDDVQFTKNDWRNRNKIKTNQGIKWITIPVYNSINKKIRETKITNKKWNINHWNNLETNYSKAKHFVEFKDIIKELYLNCNSEYLSEINFYFIQNINDILGIKTKLSWSWDYNLVNGKTERLVDLCKQSNATFYLSGPSAKNYINDSLFKNENIKLLWMDYSGYPEYNQLFPPFEHGVSILDLIFNEGKNANTFLKSFI